LGGARGEQVRRADADQRPRRRERRAVAISYDQLPCYCVGDATASSARRAGLTRIVTGPSDGSALLDMMAADGVRSALHLCGRDHVEQGSPGDPARAAGRLCVGGCFRAASRSCESDPGRRDAADPFAALWTYLRRAGRLRCLDRSTIRLLAISGAAAAALGSGWRVVASATTPTDQALLELAAKLCQNADESGPGQ
jgi:uroporphyrinogen-III synthase